MRFIDNLRAAPRSAADASIRDPAEAHAELWREAIQMVLYVSVVEIAELAAIPEQHFANGLASGPVGVQLLALLWGTAAGLAIAHWFAFWFAARGLRGGGYSRFDVQVGVAQLAGAVFVAAMASLPVLLFDDVRAQELVAVVPAVLIGIVSYIVGRASGRSRIAAALFGVTALGVGLVVAGVKTALAAH